MGVSYGSNIVVNFSFHIKLVIHTYIVIFLTESRIVITEY